MSTIIEQKVCINTLNNKLSSNETRDELPSTSNVFDRSSQMTRPYPVSLAPWRYAKIFKNMTIRL